jgi:3D (Asp-Asp-Asp) domain-containing protein
VKPGIISAVIVSVGLSSAFGGGMGYSVMRKEVTIVSTTGVVRHTTFRNTVGQVLAEANVTWQPGDEVSPAVGTRLTEGLSIVIRQAVPVAVTVDGETLYVNSSAPSVFEMLARQGIALSSWDKVFPSREAALSAGMQVRVVRIQHRIVSEQMAIPYQVRSSIDSRSPRGIVRVLSPGRLGLKEYVWKVTLADGGVVARTPIGWRVVRRATDRVVTVGTQSLIASRGEFAGKEYFDLIATGYSPFCCKGVDDVTALGVRAGYGVVAVDPKIIPLGSRLFIEGYGYALAADTGSAIKGLRIDLGFDTKRQALTFGRRPIRVYVIQKKQRRK